jgi:hypothetical protein
MRAAYPAHSDYFLSHAVAVKVPVMFVRIASRRFANGASDLPYIDLTIYV